MQFSSLSRITWSYIPFRDANRWRSLKKLTISFNLYTVPWLFLQMANENGICVCVCIRSLSHYLREREWEWNSLTIWMKRNWRSKNVFCRQRMLIAELIDFHFTTAHTNMSHSFHRFVFHFSLSISHSIFISSNLVFLFHRIYFNLYSRKNE